MVLYNIAIFRHFWFSTSFMGYVNCEYVKEMTRIRSFEKSCHYLSCFCFEKLYKLGFFLLPCYTSFPIVIFSNSATAGPQPGMKKEQGLNHTEHTGKSQKVSYNLT